MSHPSHSSSTSAAAASLLARQLKQMRTDKDIPGISCGLVNDSNVFEWEVMLMISDDVKYYGGTSQARARPSSSPSPPSPPLPLSPLSRVSKLTPTLLSRRVGGGVSLHTGANFRARLSFPPNYPIMPPTLVFQEPIPFHH